jgi:hypothetical protein
MYFVKRLKLKKMIQMVEMEFILKEGPCVFLIDDVEIRHVKKKGKKLDYQT